MRQRFSVALSSGYDADKFLGVQLRAFGDNPGAGHTQVMHSFGFASRPVDPTSNDDGLIGCIVQQISRGTAEEFAYLAHDPRYISKIPPLSQGSSCVYNSKGAFLDLDAATDTLTGYVPVPGAKAHSLAIGYDSSSPPKLVLNLVHADGMAILMSDEGITIKDATGASFIRIDASGVTVSGAAKLTSGLDVGGSGAQPVINATLFEAWWASMVLAVSGAGIPGAAVGAAMATMTATLPTTGTVLLKGL